MTEKQKLKKAARFQKHGLRIGPRPAPRPSRFGMRKDKRPHSVKLRPNPT